MTSDNNSISSEQRCYNEFVIADFGKFQIVIASGVTLIPRTLFSIQVPIPSRYYSTSGILFWESQPAFNLSGLTLKSLFSEISPFPSLKRIATGIPLSFEVKSCEPLPQDLTQLATLKCQMPGELMSYHTVFRNIAPRFVQILPDQGIPQLTHQVRRCLQPEQNEFKSIGNS